MSYTIPNEADASTYPAQAEPDAGDFRALGHAASGSGVLFGLQVAPGNTGVDRSVTIGFGRLVYGGWDHVAHSKTTIASGSITADGTHPRWALIHSTDSGRTLTVSLGTAAANPVFPSVAELEVVLAAIYLPAGATSITATNIIDKRVLQPGSLASAAVYQPRTLPPSAPKRASYARFGAPGYDGTNNLSASTAYTLYDSTDTDYGGLSGYTTGPGCVTKIAVYFMSNAWQVIEGLSYIRVTYDDETAYAIDMPQRRWANSGYASGSGAHNARHPLWTWYSPGGAAQYSWTFSMPMPFLSKCKIELVTPSTVGGHKIWSIVDYVAGSNFGFGARKLRPIWWCYPHEGSGDRAATNASTGRADQSASYMTQHHWWDAGWGSRLQATGGVNDSTTTFEVYNGPAFTRNLPVGVKDPLTGTAITNVTTALAPDCFAMVDSEVVKITAISGNTLTVTRAQAHPITGVATSAASHAEKAMLKRIVGPTKIELIYLWGQSTGSSDAWMESPVGLYLDADTAMLSGGQLPSVGSGGMEDFFGTGWYIGAGASTSDPFQGCHMRRAWGAGFYRWWQDLWCDSGFAFLYGNGESGQGSPGNTYMGSTIWAYTSH